MLNAMNDLRRVVLATAALAVLAPVVLANVAEATPPIRRHVAPAAVVNTAPVGDVRATCAAQGDTYAVARAPSGGMPSGATPWDCPKVPSAPPKFAEPKHDRIRLAAL